MHGREGGCPQDSQALRCQQGGLRGDGVVNMGLRLQVGEIRYLESRGLGPGTVQGVKGAREVPMGVPTGWASPPE